MPLPPEDERVPDTYPEPEGNVTEGTSKVFKRDSPHSALDPYAREVSIFRAQEFAKLDRVSVEDFMVCTSALDGELRYIRKAFIESISSHRQGSIIRTYSGDFHVVRHAREEVLLSMERHTPHTYNTERELLKTQLKELTARVEALEEKTNA